MIGPPPGRGVAPADRWEEPENLIADLGIRAPEEVDVEAIAEFAGATVVYEELHGCGASTVGRGDHAVITVDRSVSRERQRFAAAHELAHWLLDRGGAPFARDDPWPEEVEWCGDNEEGEVGTIERRADEWALALLMPYRLLDKELSGGAPVTFDTVRQLAGSFQTSPRNAAQRLVVCSCDHAMLISTRPGEPSRCLRRNYDGLDYWLREQPGPGTGAHDLLEDPRRAPGPREVVLDQWIDLPQAWWLTVREDSQAMPDGEILSLLSATGGDGFSCLVEEGERFPLAAEPGPDAARQLVAALELELWGYRRVSVDPNGRRRNNSPGVAAPGETVLEARERPHRIVIPDPASLDKAALRRLVDEVARHQGTPRDDLLLTMVDCQGAL